MKKKIAYSLVFNMRKVYKRSLSASDFYFPHLWKYAKESTKNIFFLLKKMFFADKKSYVKREKRNNFTQNQKWEN
jgi:hypothetical protein